MTIEKDVVINRSGHAVMAATLLDAIVATGDGEWVDVSRYKNKSIEVIGITTATLQIVGSNLPAQPAAGVNVIVIGSDITEDGLVEVTIPIKWIKTICTAWTTGTISAYLIAQEF